MGIICELYRISDADIDRLEKLDTNDIEEILIEQYTSIYGAQHQPGDTVFSMDKYWDITRFLIIQTERFPVDAAELLIKTYIHSEEVKFIHEALRSIEIHDLMRAYHRETLIANHVYRAEYDLNWEFIDSHHLKVYKAAFAKASEMNSGVVVDVR